jgi:type IV pilus assembly protein PilA
VAAYRDRWGTMPRDNVAAGLPPSAALRGAWVQGIEVHEGVVEVTFTRRLSSRLNRELVLSLRPATDPQWPTGALSWVCHEGKPAPGLQVPALGASAAELPAGFVPGLCRR